MGLIKFNHQAVFNTMLAGLLLNVMFLLYSILISKYTEKECSLAAVKDDRLLPPIYFTERLSDEPGKFLPFFTYIYLHLHETWILKSALSTIPYLAS